MIKNKTCKNKREKRKDKMGIKLNRKKNQGEWNLEKKNFKMNTKKINSN
jgi:hypothetical protein